MSKREDAAARWRDTLRRQAGSGWSVAAFCRRWHIPQASFYFWRRKLRDAATFTEVHVVPERDAANNARPAEGALDLVLPGGRRIVVRPGFDHATLAALVGVLEHGVWEDGMAVVGGVESAMRKRGSGA